MQPLQPLQVVVMPLRLHLPQYQRMEDLLHPPRLLHQLLQPQQHLLPMIVIVMVMIRLLQLLLQLAKRTATNYYHFSQQIFSFDPYMSRSLDNFEIILR
jgi:hypothetical protein